MTAVQLGLLKVFSGLFACYQSRIGTILQRRQFDLAVQEMEAAAAGAPDNTQVRAALALSLQNMGLMDRAAATWRSLWRMHQAASKI